MATYSSAAVFAALDRNGDGFVTKTEFLRVVGDHPGAHSAFRNLDRNGDGAISVREFKERYPNGIPQPTVSADYIFKQLDRNGDGFVTKTEFFNVVGQSPAAIKIFNSLDRNHDGAISVREFKERYPMGVPTGGSPLAPVSPISPSPLYSAASVFAALDRNGDGFVTKTEFFAAVGNSPAAVVAFESLDRNRDGAISVREFKERYPNGILSAAPPVIMSMSLKEKIAQEEQFAREWKAKKGIVIERVSSADMFARIDKNGDGFVTKTEFFQTLGHSAASLAAFNSLDNNHDGAVSIREFKLKFPNGIEVTTARPTHLAAMMAEEERIFNEVFKKNGR